jgi:type IV pilus assembly protein PilA
MFKQARQPLADQRGFTLIELLVVILIIGVLAAIAIPSLLNQRGKATDASGRELSRAAAQAAETYSTDHNGSYQGLEVNVVHEYESSIPTASGNGNAWLSAAGVLESGKGFTVTATSANGDTFTYTKLASGEVSRTCAVLAGNNPGGCATGSW